MAQTPRVDLRVTIGEYPDRKYNARIWHQRCRKCNWIGKPTLETSHAERLAYRIKKWDGGEMDTVDRSV